MKTRIKSHGDEVTDLYDEKFPKVDSNYTCLAVISLDSEENHYQQALLKECEYIGKKVVRHINDNLSDFFSSVESDESDEE